MKVNNLGCMSMSKIKQNKVTFLVSCEYQDQVSYP